MSLKSDIEALYESKQKATEKSLEAMGIPIAGVSSAMYPNKAIDTTIADLMEQRIRLKHENWLKKQKDLRNLARLMGFEKLAQSLGTIGGELVDYYQRWKEGRKTYGMKPEEGQTAEGFWKWLKYQESMLNAPLDIDEETATQLYEFANKKLPFGPEGESVK